MRVLFVNSVVDFGSTGRIVRELSKINNIESLIVYGRGKAKDANNTYKISNSLSTLWSMGSTILFNDETLLNKNSTKQLIEKIEEFKPDIVHLHNIHGYYVNYSELFNYLNSKNINIIWTLHDCWSFTGYCPHFDLVNCDKYKSGCANCPTGFTYPYSLFKQNISKHFSLKEKLFTSNSKLTIVTPSKWLKNKVKESFLKDKDIVTIQNGIDLSSFKPGKKKNKEFTILFVANYWTKTKGKEEIEKIVKNIRKEIKVVIIGEFKNVSNYLKDRCILINRTNDISELISLYSKAHLLINPTLEEVLGLVNIEALACGTPVFTYNTGGSPETIDETSGKIVDKYDYKKMATLINQQFNDYTYKATDCINRSKLFTKEKMLDNYWQLYNKILNSK